MEWDASATKKSISLSDLLEEPVRQFGGVGTFTIQAELIAYGDEESTTVVAASPMIEASFTARGIEETRRDFDSQISGEDQVIYINGQFNVEQSYYAQVAVRLDGVENPVYKGLTNGELFGHAALDAMKDAGLTNARVQVPTAEVQRMIQKQLGVTSHIISMRPDTLEYYYNRGVARRLPVMLCGSVSASPQNYIQDISLSEDSVLVYAPNAVLDTMQYAYTQVVNLSMMKENTVHNVAFRKMKGVEYEPNVVRMTAHVGYYAEKTVEVPIIGLNFPGDKELRTFPSKAKVTFRVESGRYQSINAENFVLAITYEELLQNPTDKYRLHLKSLPEGVTNARISPRDVDYLIELSEMDGGGQ